MTMSETEFRKVLTEQLRNWAKGAAFNKDESELLKLFLVEFPKHGSSHQVTYPDEQIPEVAIDVFHQWITLEKSFAREEWDRIGPLGRLLFPRYLMRSLRLLHAVEEKLALCYSTQSPGGEDWLLRGRA